MGLNSCRDGRDFLIVILLLTLAGCSTLGARTAVEMPAGTPLRAFIETVPFHPQKKYQCGPAAMAMVLEWSGVATTPEALVPVVYTPGRKGSLQPGLITAARRHGRLGYPISGLSCVLQEVAAGRPVVVLQNLGLSWLPRWHYAVIIGYDLSAQAVVLHSGVRAARPVGLKNFLYTWQRADQWGLLVLPPGSMPVCSEVAAYLNAALGLQQAGHQRAAVQAFNAAVDRWPRSAPGFMALGNALYAEGLLQEAIAAFEKAVHLDPDNGDALNNLAHLLAESGDFEKAEKAARRAIAAGGSHRDIFLQTLNEILLNKP